MISGAKKVDPSGAGAAPPAAGRETGEANADEAAAAAAKRQEAAIANADAAAARDAANRAAAKPLMRQLKAAWERGAARAAARFQLKPLEVKRPKPPEPPPVGTMLTQNFEVTPVTGDAIEIAEKLDVAFGAKDTKGILKFEDRQLILVQLVAWKFDDKTEKAIKPKDYDAIVENMMAVKSRGSLPEGEVRRLIKLVMDYSDFTPGGGGSKIE